MIWKETSKHLITRIVSAALNFPLFFTQFLNIPLMEGCTSMTLVFFFPIKKLNFLFIYLYILSKEMEHNVAHSLIAHIYLGLYL